MAGDWRRPQAHFLLVLQVAWLQRSAAWDGMGKVVECALGVWRCSLPCLLSRACFPATHLFPLEGHSNWLGCMLVAKKQRGGILKLEQLGPTGTPER